jgi:hypothetical protein
MGKETKNFPYGQSPFLKSVCDHMGSNTYANITDVPIESILPFAFPFGIGGPKMKRRVKVSLQLCSQLYLWLSLIQFMEGPTIL